MSVPERCAAPDCGLPLDKVKEAAATKWEASGRAETPAGPMHFRCYWRLQRRAVQTVLANVGREIIKTVKPL